VILKERFKKALLKKARRGFSGYPVATVAFYGPDDIDGCFPVLRIDNRLAGDSGRLWETPGKHHEPARHSAVAHRRPWSRIEMESDTMRRFFVYR
jgi:hypothetical protein